MSEGDDSGHEFRKAAEIVLGFLRAEAPMGLWSITRIENDRQTHLVLGENSYDIKVGDGVAWEDSFCVHMVSGRGPRIAPETSRVPVYREAQVKLGIEIGSYAGAPIKDSDGSIFGVLCGLDPEASTDLHELDSALAAMGQLLEVALLADRNNRRLKDQLVQAQEASTTDALTGLGNRRAWDEWLRTVQEDFHDLADPTVIVILDLDDFKSVNDGPGGHTAGDEVLRAVARSLTAVARPGDRVARIGGDEFGIVLNGCAHAQAGAIVERFTSELSRAGVKASAGWASLMVGESVKDAIQRADKAMFAAKPQRLTHHDSSREF